MDMHDEGGHQISKRLYALMKAVAPVELACASYEACDQEWGAPVLALLENWAAIKSAIDDLQTDHDQFRTIIRLFYAGDIDFKR